MSLPLNPVPGQSGHANWHALIHAILAGAEPVRITDPENATPAILSAMDDAEPGGIVVFPPGPIITDPFTVEKTLTLIGAGPFSTRLVPRTNTISPLVTFDRTVDSGFGIYGNYGPAMKGIGINRQGHMAGPCLRTESTAAWLKLHDVLCSGGTRSIEHHAPNARFTELLLWDASDAMIDASETGLELRMHNVTMSANVQDLNTFIRVTISAGAAGGLLGAIYGLDVTGNTAGGSIDVVNGLVITAPSLTEIPTFFTNLILDNITGGGPVVDLVNVQTQNFTNGWFNGSNGTARMNGCVNPRFRDVRQRGGTHSYEFVGALTTGFTSECELFTGPAYKISTANKPTLVSIEDDVAGATDIGQVTNDPQWLETSARRTWGQRRFQGHLRRRELGAAPPSGFGFLVNGVLTVSHPLVGVNSRVRVSRMSTGATGLPGELHHNVANNVVGTSFSITSTSLTDSGGVYWEFVGDGD